MKGTSDLLRIIFRTLLCLILIMSASLTSPVCEDPPAKRKKLAPGEGIFEHDQLTPAKGWPLWLKDFSKSKRTQETSGITYIGRDDENRRCFFLVDDVGAIHLCRVEDNGPDEKGEISLESVSFSKSIFDELSTNDVWDFEAIAAEPSGLGAKGLASEIEAFLAVEGRGDKLIEQTRVLKVKLLHTDPALAESTDKREWRIESMGDAIPGANFWKVLMGSNRGIEGLSASNRFLMLGLESLEKKGVFNTRGTFLYVYDKVTEQSASIRTIIMGIHSITGICSVGDSITVLMDRNRQRLTLLEWEENDNEMWVSACHHFPLDLPAPDGFRYHIPSVEGLAIDDVGDFWCVTDPWSGHYEAVGAAPETLHVYLAAEVPMIYRFSGTPIWQAAELGHTWPSNTKD